MKKILLTTMIGLLFTTCDPGTDCYMYVYNNTANSIDVITTKEFLDSRPVETITTRIPPFEDKLVYKYLVLDTPPYLCFMQYGFSSITIINETDTCKRDLMNPFLWELTSVKNGLNYDASFNIIINPEDFE